MAGIFITGATGSVGSRLVAEYLRATGHALYLLVRAASQADAEARLAKVLSFWDLQFADYRGRIHLMRGDTDAPDLGLRPEHRAAMRGEVQFVIHAASSLRLDLTLEDARRQILGGTQRVWSFAQSLERLERFAYVSTMEVIGRCASVVREEFLTTRNIRFLNNYERGKFESEEFLRERIAEGWPIMVLRVSMVVGEMATGRLPSFRTFYLLLEKLLLNPDFPILPAGAPFDIIPIDFVSQAIVKLMAFPGSNSQIYHLSQGLLERPLFRDFLRQATPVAERALGRRLRRPIFVWVGFHRALFSLCAVLTSGARARFFRVQLIFLEYFGLSWRFDNQKTQATLRALGLEWPKLKNYLPALLTYYLSQRPHKRFPF